MAVQPPDAGTSPTAADQPQTDEATKNLVARWCKEVRADKKHFEPKFKKMRGWQKLARQGAEDDWIQADKYTVPIITRHINLAVAGLYAKNPRVKAQPRKRMLSTIWDGSAATLMQATKTMQDGVAQMQQAAATGQQVVPNPAAQQAQAIVEDAQKTQDQLTMLRRICQTLEILWNYFTKEQSPNFKTLMKQFVRRTKVNGVAYVKLNYQRVLQPVPEMTARIEDITSQIKHLENLAQQAQAGEFDDTDAKMAELKTMLADAESVSEAIVREGPVFDFPFSTSIIPHRRCRNLKGFIGCDYITHEFMMTPDEVKETYGVDLGKGFTPYREQNVTLRWHPDWGDDNDKGGLVCVWEIQNKKTGQVMTVADGYCDFIKPPAEPDVKLESF